MSRLPKPYQVVYINYKIGGWQRAFMMEKAGRLEWFKHDRSLELIPRCFCWGMD